MSKVTDEISLGVNPFNSSIQVNLKKITNKFTGKEELIDSTSNTKLFVNLSNRETVSSLGCKAAVLLLWIMYRIEYNSSYIHINRAVFKKEAGINTDNTYRKAVSELCSKKIIALTGVKDVYWINGNFFFKGNRKNLVIC